MLKSRGEKVFNVINITIMLILFAIFIFPYIIIISSSFSGERALAKYGPGFFIRDFSFASYLYIFSAGSTVLRSLGVSVYITLVTTVLSVLIFSLAIIVFNFMLLFDAVAYRPRYAVPAVSLEAEDTAFPDYGFFSQAENGFGTPENVSRDIPLTVLETRFSLRGQR